MVIWGTWRPAAIKLELGRRRKQRPLYKVCVRVCGHRRGTKSEKCSSVQVSECVSAYVGAACISVCVPRCVHYNRGEGERERERGCITNQKPWFVHMKPRGQRLQRKASATLCLHCLSLSGGRSFH